MLPQESRGLDAALRLLSYRPRGEAELRRRHLRRFPIEEVEPVIQALKSQGYVDDVAFARFWRENREQFRPRSARAIKSELLRLGVSRDAIDEALEGLDEEENALRAGRKLLSSLRGADHATFEKKLGAYLQRRGFGFAVARQAILRLWEELSEPTDGDVEGDQQKEETEDVAKEASYHEEAHWRDEGADADGQGQGGTSDHG